MKLKPLLLIPCALMALASCTTESAKRNGVFQTDLTDVSFVQYYMTYSYSYTEQKTVDNKVLFTVTANFTNLYDKYYYVDFKIKFQGSERTYVIPETGNITIHYTRYTAANPSTSALATAREAIGRYEILSARIFKIEN